MPEHQSDGFLAEAMIYSELRRRDAFGTLTFQTLDLQPLWNQSLLQSRSNCKQSMPGLTDRPSVPVP